MAEEPADKQQEADDRPDGAPETEDEQTSHGSLQSDAGGSDTGLGAVAKGAAAGAAAGAAVGAAAGVARTKMGSKQDEDAGDESGSDGQEDEAKDA